MKQQQLEQRIDDLEVENRLIRGALQEAMSIIEHTLWTIDAAKATARRAKSNGLKTGG